MNIYIYIKIYIYNNSNILSYFLYVFLCFTITIHRAMAVFNIILLIYYYINIYQYIIYCIYYILYIKIHIIYNNNRLLYFMYKGKVCYVKEPPSGESTTTECGFNYQLLAVVLLK